MPIRDAIVNFLKKLQVANEFSEQPVVVASANDKIPNIQHFSEFLKWINLKEFTIHDTGFYDILLKEMPSNYIFGTSSCCRHCNKSPN